MISEQVKAWHMQAAARAPEMVYRSLTLPAGEFELDAPLDVYCAEYAPLHCAIRGQGAGVTRLVVSHGGEYAIKASRGFGPGPSFALAGVTLVRAGAKKDGVIVNGVQRALVCDDVHLEGFRRGLVQMNGTGECTFRAMRIAESDECAIFAEISTTGANVWENVTAVNEHVEGSGYAFEIVSNRGPEDGGECNQDAVLVRAFGRWRGGVRLRGKGQSLFFLGTHCIADSAQFRGEAWLVENAGNVHLTGSWAVTHAEGASAVSLSSAKGVRLTGCTMHAQHGGADICIRGSQDVLIAGSMLTGPAQHINADDESRFVETANLQRGTQ